MDGLSAPKSLGQDLRVVRKQRELTLADVAARVGRSVGWLSQVERNISAPNHEELADLATALDISVESFLADTAPPPGEADVIVRRDARRPLGPRITGLDEELVSPDLTDDFEVVYSTFHPGAERDEPVSRPTQEVAYIVSGALEITIDDKTFAVGPGDSFRLREQSFRWANRGSDPCIAIWVIAPPVY